MSGFRTWMYPHKDERGSLRPEFCDGVKIFLEFALSSRGCSSEGMISCPCSRCCNSAYLDNTIVNVHLYRWGFMPEYLVWLSHGESYSEYGFEYELGETSHGNMSEDDEDGDNNAHMDMVHDVFPQFNSDDASNLPEEPNAEAKAFYELFKAAEQPVWPGHDKTLLDWVSEIMSYKTGFRVSQAAVDKFVKSARSMAPVEHQHLIPDSFRKIKQIMMRLGLTVIKYDVCPKDCFLYYKEGEDLDRCPICDEPRYLARNNDRGKNIAQKKLWYFPITERLQRLYMSRKTAEHMTWHTNCKPHSEKVIHPAGSQAWKEFDERYPSFADDPRNVRLGLSSDGFEPNKGTSGKSHSIWPVFVTPYNLPPDLAMRQELIFLTLIIAGPNSPGKSIDVMLRPLIDELKTLWNDGAITYDFCKKQNFNMRAAVMWTISDFPAYGMLSGWSTHGKLACPCCMEATDSRQLKHGRKPCWFDCHRKFLPQRHRERSNTNDYIRDRVVTNSCPERKSGEQIKNAVDALPPVTFGEGYRKIPGFGVEHNWTKRSIFWELPYWSSLKIRHNLDVMHIEKNVFENVKCTIFDDPKTSKDNMNSRKDLEELTNRRSLFLRDDSNRKPKASYTLTAAQRKAVCDWLKSLRFPDGHASNVANKVKLDSARISGLKSHDCHVFMQRLLPIAFRDFLPEPIWEALTELSNFFRALCANEIAPLEMFGLGRKVIETICKLEKIFPPSFFDSMEHLIVHLPYEAMVAGPVFYRWMYPFERKMWVLKNNYMNKNRYEGSICEAYLMTEVTHFCSFYFGRDVDAPATRLRRNETLQVSPAFFNQLSIFIPKGQPLGKAIVKEMSAVDMNAALLYILGNCPEVDPYIRMFEDQFGGRLSVRDMERKRVTDLIPWLRGLARAEHAPMDSRIHILLFGAYQFVETYGGYVGNGLRFHTEDHGRLRKTMCSGVSLASSDTTYYGMLQEVVVLTFHGLGFPPQNICLFKCNWYDHQRGVRVHPKYGLVDIDSNKRFRTAEPFILAEQARQVYYSEYPSSRIITRPSRRGIWAVCPIRARHVVDISSITPTDDTEMEYYQDPVPPPLNPIVDELSGFVPHNDLADHDAGLIDIPDDEETDEGGETRDTTSSEEDESDCD